tara:strand:- start:1253 stop:1543 length:291 start_codon:yes stop_codon:yes gene_type:complete
MKLIKLVKLKTGLKKYQAIFKKPDGKEKKTSFGASGYTDYTLSGDKKKRDAYRKRHVKDLKTKDPTRAGYLSFYILWGDSTSIQTNLKAYKKRFNL